MVTYKPKTFIFLVIISTWIPWVILAILNVSLDSVWQKLLIGVGGAMPAVVALSLIKKYHSEKFRKDYWSRVFTLKFSKEKASWLILLPFFYVLISVSISLLFFNGSIYQLIPTIHITGLIPFIIFVFFFGPFPEELGWRGYLLDALAKKNNLLISSILIGAIWGIWHIPLFFISGYPLQEMATSNLFLFTYFASLIPKAIIISYIYYKSGRIILTAILFHFMINFMGMVVEIEMTTELIQFFVITLISILIILKNNSLFFNKTKNNE